MPNVAPPSSHHAEFHDTALPWLPHVARYARLLTRDAADADDLAQETFLRAFQNWHTFRAGSDCRKWLFTICRNVFLRDRQRASRFVAEADAETEVRLATDIYQQTLARGLEHLFDHIDIAPAIARTLRDLPDEYREAVHFVDVEGFTYAEAAVAIDAPIGTVRSRLFRGRRLMQQALTEYARDMGWSIVVPSIGREVSNR